MNAILARGVMNCDAWRAGDSIAILALSSTPTRTDFGPDTGTTVECRVCLQPERPCVVGRADGTHVPYLAEGYRSSPIVPTSGVAILWGGGCSHDKYVSRAHFMLRAVAGGILFVNGVPGRDGNLRPPPNVTYMLEPNVRPFGAGEEHWVGPGLALLIRLPNWLQIRIQAG